MWSKVVLIGAGGVAESLLYNLSRHHIHPVAIYNRTIERAEALRERYSPSTEIIDKIDTIPRDADGYLFAVSDTSIPEIASKMPSTRGTWMHTSATVPLDVLTQYHKQSAIFYPLNTFSPHCAIDLEGVPLFFETSSEPARAYLLQLAEGLKLVPIASTLILRRRMHIAAVFVCNFVNHLLAKGSELMKAEELSFDLLKPLIEETLRKALLGDPASVQTGPAKRGDIITLQRHRAELEAMRKDLIPLYDLLSTSILQQYHPSIDSPLLPHE